MRLGWNFGALRTFTEWLNLAAEAQVQDSDGVSVDSEALSRIRKLPLQLQPQALSQPLPLQPRCAHVRRALAGVGLNLHPQRVGLRDYRDMALLAAIRSRPSSLCHEPPFGGASNRAS